MQINQVTDSPYSLRGPAPTQSWPAVPAGTPQPPLGGKLANKLGYQPPALSPAILKQLMHAMGISDPAVLLMLLGGGGAGGGAAALMQALQGRGQGQNQWQAA